jgi:hypothetical protein
MLLILDHYTRHGACYNGMTLPDFKITLVLPAFFLPGGNIFGE